MVCRYSGPLIAWRIADNRHRIFSGTGASLYGARWNTPGFPVIYASASYACAMLERLAYTGVNRMPRNQRSVRIDIPDSIEIEEIDAADISGWDSAHMRASRKFGDAWLRSARTCVLVVPSVVAPHEKNVLINESHPEFGRIAAGDPQPVKWDSRIFRFQ